MQGVGHHPSMAGATIAQTSDSRIWRTSNTSPPGERQKARRRVPSAALTSIGGTSTSVPSATRRSSSASTSATSKTAWVSPTGRGGQAVVEHRHRGQEQAGPGEVEEGVFERAVRRASASRGCAARRRARRNSPPRPSRPEPSRRCSRAGPPPCLPCPLQRKSAARLAPGKRRSAGFMSAPANG